MLSDGIAGVIESNNQQSAQDRASPNQHAAPLYANTPVPSHATQFGVLCSQAHDGRDAGAGR